MWPFGAVALGVSSATLASQVTAEINKGEVMSSAMRNTNSALSDLLIEPKAEGSALESIFEYGTV